MSLPVLIQKVDKYFEEDRIFPLVCTVAITRSRLALCFSVDGNSSCYLVGQRREISERHYRLETLHAESKMVVEETASSESSVSKNMFCLSQLYPGKKELEHRRKGLEERKRFLVSARILEETNISDTADLVQEVEEERLLSMFATHFTPNSRVVQRKA